MIRAMALVAATATLFGCASTMSGVGGTDHYACQAPVGVQCTSVSGVYANAIRNNLPGQIPNSAIPVLRAALPPKAAPDTSILPAEDTLRAPPRVLRLWIAPWEDSDGDLHQASTLQVVVDTGRWMIEHERSRIRDGYGVVLPPKTRMTSDAAPLNGASPKTGIPPLPPAIPGTNDAP